MDEASGQPAPSHKTYPRVRVSALARRILVLAAVVAVCGLTYGFMLVQSYSWKPPVEAEFGAAPSEARVRLYLQPLQIDPINDSIQIRVSVLPDPALADEVATIADRDFLLKIKRGTQTEHVQIHANQPPPEVTYDFDLDSGEVKDYPLDHYEARVSLAASERGPDGSEKPLAIHATVWEGLLGFRLKGQVQATQKPGMLLLQFAIERTGGVAFFGIAIYGAMAVMTLCALIISGLVFIGIRQSEVTLVGAFGAMIFALPALRNTLPGTPPLGVRADFLIFFWAELGAVIALCLFIAAWIRSGARP